MKVACAAFFLFKKDALCAPLSMTTGGISADAAKATTQISATPAAFDVSDLLLSDNSDVAKVAPLTLATLQSGSANPWLPAQVASESALAGSRSRLPTAPLVDDRHTSSERSAFGDRDKELMMSHEWSPSAGNLQRSPKEADGDPDDEVMMPQGSSSTGSRPNLLRAAVAEQEVMMPHEGSNSFGSRPSLPKAAFVEQRDALSSPRGHASLPRAVMEHGDVMPHGGSTARGRRNRKEHRTSSKATMSGAVATLDEQGYQAVAALNDSREMWFFIRRVVEAKGLDVLDEGMFNGLVPYYSGERDVQNFDRLQEELFDSGVKRGMISKNMGRSHAWSDSMGSKLSAVYERTHRTG